MKDTFMSVLRNKNSSIAEFRDAAEKLSALLAVETSQFVKHKSITLQTPLAETNSAVIASENIIIIPILRSGLAMLPAFQHYYSLARVGFLGFKRDEKTFRPNFYYANIPKINADNTVIILDPMLATAGTLTAALHFIKEEYKIAENKIIYAGIIASKEGLRILESDFPKVHHVIAQVDEKLDTNKYIVPGLGDFGDRFFGTL